VESFHFFKLLVKFLVILLGLRSKILQSFWKFLKNGKMFHKNVPLFCPYGVKFCHKKTLILTCILVGRCFKRLFWRNRNMLPFNDTSFLGFLQLMKHKKFGKKKPNCEYCCSLKIWGDFCIIKTHIMQCFFFSPNFLMLQP